MGVGVLGGMGEWLDPRGEATKLTLRVFVPQLSRLGAARTISPRDVKITLIELPEPTLR